MKPATRTLAPDSHVMCGQRAQDVDPTCEWLLKVKTISATRNEQIVGSRYPIASMRRPRTESAPTNRPRLAPPTRLHGVGCRINARPVLCTA